MLQPVIFETCHTLLLVRMERRIPITMLVPTEINTLAGPRALERQVTTFSGTLSRSCVLRIIPLTKKVILLPVE